MLQKFDSLCYQLLKPKDKGDAGFVFADRLKNLSYYCENSAPPQNSPEATENIWKLFFPEGAGLSSASKEAIQNLREKRVVSIIDPVPEPIANPAQEILFTSNIQYQATSDKSRDSELDLF